MCSLFLSFVAKAEVAAAETAAAATRDVLGGQRRLREAGGSGWSVRRRRSEVLFAANYGRIYRGKRTVISDRGRPAPNRPLARPA